MGFLMHTMRQAFDETPALSVFVIWKLFLDRMIAERLHTHLCNFDCFPIPISMPWGWVGRAHEVPGHFQMPVLRARFRVINNHASTSPLRSAGLRCRCDIWFKACETATIFILTHSTFVIPDSSFLHIVNVAVAKRLKEDPLIEAPDRGSFN